MADIIRNKRMRSEMVPEPATSGWGELHKTVRTADINKVDDCRDDIDTLLVFAGLYSAVLTAFVIESYTHLQQDTQDAIVGLLQQLVAKNFTSGPGYMNSTNPSPQLPPFEPPVWAIRVNVLWFTSLLLSLASASFGILVKQWLREYLAIDYAAPRERLRARQYRYPAMEEWKVFEIAAFLPLLLQLSLGLFFIGLCFFTSVVHQSIGRTTTPLVCAWAFALFVSAIAPLFSPRCPFKTTFLKRALRVGRRYIASLSYDFTQSVLPHLERILDYISRATHMARSCGHVARCEVYRCWRSLTMFTCRLSMRSRTSNDLYARARLVPVGEELRLRQKQEHATRKLIALLEEDEVVKGEEEDADILLSIDSFMSDDGLLLPMLDALRQQSGTTSAKVVSFVIRIIGHRVGQDLCEKRRLACTPDLTVLSKYAWTVLTDGIVDALVSPRTGLLVLNGANADCLFNVITILRSFPYHQLSDRATGALQEIALVPMRTSDHRCSGGVQPYQYLFHQTGTTPSHAVHSLQIKGDSRCLRCVTDIYRTLMCPSRSHYHLSLRHLLVEHISDGVEPFVGPSKGTIQDLLDVLMSFLLGAISSHMDLAEIHGSHEALHIILQYSEKFGRRGDAIELCNRMLLTESGTRMLLVPFAALYPTCRVDADIPEMLRSALRSTSTDGKFFMTPLTHILCSPEWTDYNRIRSHLTAVCEWFCNGDDGGDDDVPLDYVRLCAAFVCVTGADNDRALAKAIEKYHQMEGWQGKIGVKDYWYEDTQTTVPTEIFKGDQDLACEVLKNWGDRILLELVDALWVFVPEERRQEVLRSIRRHDVGYMPPTRPAPSAAPKNLRDGGGGVDMA